MRRENLTDEQVEAEIIRLRGSEEVKLAQKEIRIKNKRRLYMHQLRHMYKRGAVLMEQGITSDNIETELFGEQDDE